MGRFALYLLCISLMLSPLLAEAPKAVEPDTMGAVYQLDSSDQSLKPLPKEAAKVVTHRKGFTGATGNIQIPGQASTFRVKAGTDLEFVVKCTNPESYELFIFQKKGSNREAVVSKAKGKFFGGVDSQREGTVALDVAKHGEMSYRFKVKGLQPGEYGFVTGWSVFHFAVDPS